MQNEKMTFSDDMKAKGFRRSAIWMKHNDWRDLEKLMEEMGYKHAGSLIAKLIAEKLQKQH